MVFYKNKREEVKKILKNYVNGKKLILQGTNVFRAYTYVTRDITKDEYIQRVNLNN